jgi:hypothetical protein
MIKDKTVLSNNSPEPTAVGAVHAARKAWLSFFR